MWLCSGAGGFEQFFGGYYRTCECNFVFMSVPELCRCLGFICTASVDLPRSCWILCGTVYGNSKTGASIRVVRSHASQGLWFQNPSPGNPALKTGKLYASLPSPSFMQTFPSTKCYMLTTISPAVTDFSKVIRSSAH